MCFHKKRSFLPLTVATRKRIGQKKARKRGRTMVTRGRNQFLVMRPPPPTFYYCLLLLSSPLLFSLSLSTTQHKSSLSLSLSLSLFLYAFHRRKGMVDVAAAAAAAKKPNRLENRREEEEEEGRPKNKSPFNSIASFSFVLCPCTKKSWGL